MIRERHARDTGEPNRSEDDQQALDKPAWAGWELEPRIWCAEMEIVSGRSLVLKAAKMNFLRNTDIPVFLPRPVRLGRASKVWNRGRCVGLSMHNWVGGYGSTMPALPEFPGPGYSDWKAYRMLTDFVNPGPSRTFVMVDEREDSINDGYFASDLENKLGYTTIVDFPGSYHSRGASLTFADGHAESHRWRDPQMSPPLVRGELLQLNVASPDNADMAWLQTHISVRRKPGITAGSR
jgi:prepilin-type processing-associated H-X9-DG protein